MPHNRVTLVTLAPSTAARPLGRVDLPRPVEIAHRAAEHRLRRKRQPFVPAAVAHHRDLRKAVAVLQVEPQVADEPAGRPSRPTPQIEQERDPLTLSLSKGCLDFRLERIIIARGQPAAGADFR